MGCWEHFSRGSLIQPSQPHQTLPQEQPERFLNLNHFVAQLCSRLLSVSSFHQSKYPSSHLGLWALKVSCVTWLSPCFALTLTLLGCSCCDTRVSQPLTTCRRFLEYHLIKYHLKHSLNITSETFNSPLPVLLPILCLFFFISLMIIVTHYIMYLFCMGPRELG